MPTVTVQTVRNCYIFTFNQSHNQIKNKTEYFTYTNSYTVFNLGLNDTLCIQRKL